VSVRRRAPRLTPEQVLGAVPLRNERLRLERIEGGGLRLYVERRSEWWMRLLGAVFPIPKERAIELDGAGEELWDLCDGGRTVRDLIRIFQERHKLSRAEAEWSLRTYLRDMGKRGLVALAVERSESTKGEAKHGT